MWSVLAVMALTAGLAVVTARVWAVPLAAVCVAWIFVDQPVEGPVLWSVTATHGLALADLLSPAGVVWAAGRVVAQARRARPRHL